MIFLIYFFAYYLVHINCDEYYETTTEYYKDPDTYYTNPDTYYTNPDTYYTHPDYNTTPEIDEYNPMKTIFALVRGSSVDKWLSSDQVAYCKLISPKGIIFYDNFGPCRLTIDRVTREHDGRWEKQYAYPQDATLIVQNFFIDVNEPAPKTKVHTVVEESSPNTMTITCSLPSTYQVQGCKFRGPLDLKLLATGTTENIVKFYDTGFRSRLEGSGCSLVITNPRIGDLGFWRCAMYTENDTYFGFVTVLSTWFLNETSVVNTIRRGPLLRADHKDISVNQGDPVTMSCSIDAPIRYCYFWMSDGSLFNVSPGLNSSSMEYVGSGFDAGECGLKLYDLNYRNVVRRWTCNVGIYTGRAEREQQSDFYVYIRDRMQVSQDSYGDFVMILSALVENNRELEYCRYIQDNGYGFSYDTAPGRYEFTGSLFQGSCELRIRFPDTWSDYSPWTIVAKVKGEDEEISGRTRGLPVPSYQQYSGSSGWQIFGWVMLTVVIAGVFLGVALGPQRNRKWVARRATIVRQSLRRQPPPPYTLTT